MAQSNLELDRGMSLDELVQAILRHRRSLLGGALAGAFLALVLMVVTPRRYTAVALVKTRGESQALGGLSGLAAEFGVRLPTQGGGYTPDLVAELLTSRVVLEGVAARILAAEDANPGRLALVREVEDRPTAERPEALARDLRLMVRTNVSAQSGLIELRVSLPEAGFAPEAATLILQETRRVLEEVRQTEAKESRDYFEVVTARAADDLRVAEDRLRDFLARNRSLQGSPALQVAQERLQREVNQRQEIALALYRGMAEATLSEQRALSALSIAQPPIASVRPDPRRGLLKLMFGFLVGGGAAVCVLVLRSLWQRRATIHLGT